MALYMRNTQPSCDAASYTVKILVPKQTQTKESDRCTVRAEIVIEKVSVSLFSFTE